VRIAYLLPDLGIPVGGTKGASAHVRGLVRAFTDLGHEVRVLAAEHPANDAVGFAVEGFAPTPLGAAMREAGPLPVGRALGHVWNNVTVERALLETVAGWRPDLVYERHSPFSAAGSLVCRRLGIPHVLEVNAPLAQEGNRYRKQALGEAAEALERAAFGAAGRIVAVSRDLADILVAEGVDRERIQVVPNGVDTDLFGPEGPRFDGVPADRTVVGFVGTLKPWHGIETLIEAFETVAVRADLHLHVVGHGPLAKPLRALGERLPGRVTLTDAVSQEDVPHHLRAMDLAVAPYPELEPFYFSPLKVLEYLATGRALVASRIGQVPELVEHGRTGWLVPPGDTAALAAAFVRLAGDAPLRHALGEAAAREAREKHPWRRRAADILAADRREDRCSA
jgi:glycosyltransferase involved in cell wall biosynthesis